MVTRDWVNRLMHTTLCLTYIYERCRSVSEIPPFQSVQVKGENCILETLISVHGIVKQVSSVYPSLSSAEKEIYDSIVYLDKKYSSEHRFLGLPFYLDFNDSKNLMKDSRKWSQSLINLYEERGTIYITQSNFEELFSEQLLSTLNDSTVNDLLDAYNCVIHLIPTPAAMISFRVAESIVRQIYEIITGSSHNQKLWSELTNELKKSQKLSHSFIGYLDFLRQKRNEAEHPDKRFSQEESERILLQIKGLLEERLNIT